MTALFLSVLGAVVVGTGLALAGRWRPRGLPGPAPAAPVLRDGGQPRFDVVLRGYRMDQVDAELARLHTLLGERGSQAAGPAGGAPATRSWEGPAAPGASSPAPSGR